MLFSVVALFILIKLAFPLWLTESWTLPVVFERHCVSERGSSSCLFVAQDEHCEMCMAPSGDYCRQLMGFNGAGKDFVVDTLFGDPFGKMLAREVFVFDIILLHWEKLITVKTSRAKLIKEQYKGLHSLSTVCFV